MLNGRNWSFGLIWTFLPELSQAQSGLEPDLEVWPHIYGVRPPNLGGLVRFGGLTPYFWRQTSKSGV